MIAPPLPGIGRDDAARDRVGGRLHAHGEVLAGADAARPGDADIELGAAEAGGGDRDGHLALGAGGELDGAAGGIGRDQHRAAHVEIDEIGAGRPLDIVDGEMEARLVADGEEARQRRLRHDLVAHDDVGAGLAGAAGRPGDSHHAHRAVEGGQVELDPGRAVGPDLDHAGIAGDRLLRRLFAGERGARRRRRCGSRRARPACRRSG